MADGVASFIDRTAPIKSSLLELQKQPPISIQSTSDEARKRTFQLHLLRTKRLNFHTGLRHSFVSAKREPKPQTKRNKKMATAEIDSSSSTSGSSAVVAAVNAPAPFFFWSFHHIRIILHRIVQRQHVPIARYETENTPRWLDFLNRFVGVVLPASFSFRFSCRRRRGSFPGAFCFVLFRVLRVFFSFRAVPPREPHRNRVSNTPTRQ